MTGWLGIASLLLLAPGPLSGPGRSVGAVFLVDGEGRVEVRNLAPDEGIRSLESPFDRAWLWLPTEATRRIGREDLPFDRRATRAPDPRLELTVAGKLPEPNDLFVVAAPPEMWTEVPESLLPRWPVPDSGRVAVPRDGKEALRLRFVSERLGTTWIEVREGESAPPPVRLEPATTRHLAVVDPDGRPIPGAEGGLFAATDRFEFAELDRPLARVGELRRDKRGSTLLLGCVPQERAMALRVRAPGFASATVTGTPAALPERVVLRPGSTLRGHAVERVGEASRPVDGASVHVAAYATAARDAIVRERTTTDATGAFEIRDLPRGEAVITFEADGFARRRLPVDAGAAELDLGRIELERSMPLLVDVVDARGAPIAGATVSERSGASAATDDRGRARLDGLPRGEPLGLAVEASGFLPEHRDALLPLEVPLRVELRRGFRATGRLLRPDRLPVATGVASFIQALGGGSTRGGPPAEISEGRFVLLLPPETAIRLELRSPETRSLAVELTTGGAGGERDLGDLVAPDGLAVVGWLIDEATALPVAGGSVWAPRSERPLADWIFGRLARDSSDAEGRFELSGLEPAPALLRVDAPGYARRHVPVRPQDDLPTVDLGFVGLERGADVEIAVTGGAVGSGAEAIVDLRGERLALDYLRSPVTENRAVVRHVPSGRAVVAVERAGRRICETTLDVPRGADRVRADCDAGGIHVEGTVAADGAPIGPGHLHWMAEQPRNPTSSSMTWSSPEGLRTTRRFGNFPPDVTVAVDPDGLYETDELSPGRWQVAWLGGGAFTLGEPQPVEIGHTRDQFVPIDVTALRIDGWVVDEEGGPVADARVRELDGGATAFSNPEGEFELAVRRVGLLRVQAQSGGRRSEELTVDVRPDERPEPVVLRLDDPEELNLPIVVRAPDGSGATGARVVVELPDGRAASATAALGGAARVRIETPLPERLRVAVWANGPWLFSGWVELDEVRDGWTVEVPAPGALEISSEERVGDFRVVRDDGWDVTELLARMGASPFLRRGEPAFVAGLPPGRYVVLASDLGVSASVRSGRIEAVELP